MDIDLFDIYFIPFLLLLVFYDSWVFLHVRCAFNKFPDFLYRHLKLS